MNLIQRYNTPIYFKSLKKGTKLIVIGYRENIDSTYADFVKLKYYPIGIIVNVSDIYPSMPKFMCNEYTCGGDCIHISLVDPGCDWFMYKYCICHYKLKTLTGKEIIFP